jgi:hypothetical protein
VFWFFLQISETLFILRRIQQYMIENVQVWGNVVVGESRDRFLVASVAGDFFRSYRQNYVPWGRLSLYKWVPWISPGVKAAGAQGWRPTTLVVPNVKKIRGLNLPGTPWATSASCGRPLPLWSKMCIILHVKWSFVLSDFDEPWIFFERFYKNPQTPNFMKIRPVGDELFYADSRTWRS